MVYGFLPNKKGETYLKFFQMIKIALNDLNFKLKSVSVDFETGVINSYQTLFPDCQIVGCFFHLSQNLMKKVRKYGLKTKYLHNSLFRKLFKMLQALAYVPCVDVIAGFNIVKKLTESSCTDFTKIVDNFEKNYIGLFKTNSQSIRVICRFPINLWNLYERVQQNLPRTNNSVESWHGTISESNNSHLTVNKCIDLFKLEQSNTENWLVHLESGLVVKRKNKTILKDEMILNVLNTYKLENITSYLENMSFNMN